MLIRIGYESRLIPFDDIVFCEVIDRKIYLHLLSSEVIDYSYKKLLENFRLNTKLSLLEQEEHSLSQYVMEAKSRYEKTKSFRHDIKNHTIVLKKLIQEEKTEQAISYMGGMEEIDNAVNACKNMEHDSEKYIRIAGKIQGDFILLEVENSFQKKGLPRKGTGQCFHSERIAYHSTAFRKHFTANRLNAGFHCRKSEYRNLIQR